MKLGLIGPGRHGSRYLQERNGGRYFTRVLSRAARTDLPDWVKGTTDPEEFFAPGLDGVVIATPTPEHAGMATECLVRGLHVLCEKPLCETLEDGLLAIALAESAGLRLLVAHTDLFHSGWAPPECAPKKAVSIFAGPGEATEWAPHAAATIMALSDCGAVVHSLRMNDKAMHLRCSTIAAELHARIEIGPVRHRKVFAKYADGSHFAFDGNAPSDPSPIRNMLDVFTSGKPDRRMSYDFTRAVYRVLLTDPD